MPDVVDPLWIFSASVFGLVALLAAFAFRMFYEAGRRGRVSRRLRMGERRLDEHAHLMLRRNRMSAKARLVHFTWLRTLHAQSGIGLTPATLTWACAGVAATLVVALSLWIDLVAALAIGIAVVALAPLIVLHFMRRRRQGRFADQFPEAIDIIVRSLRSGHPIAMAIRAVAQGLPGPAGPEFGILQDEIAFGLDLEAAMRNLAARVGQQDLPLFVTSISIQSQTGGNLTEVLENLGGTIRARIKLGRKVRALSSEGRISAIILGAVPFFLFAAVNVLVPSFYGPYWGHPWINLGLSGAVLWMLTGFAIMRKMINFRS